MIRYCWGTKIMDILYHLAVFIDPNPIEYIRLATVSRTWYCFFMSDRLWRHLDPYGYHRDLAFQFLEAAKNIPTTELALHWYSKITPAVPQIPGNPYCLLGVLANYIPSDDFREVLSFYTSNKQLVLCGVNLNPHSLQCAEQRLRGNRLCVSDAVSRAGCALKYAADPLKSIPEIVYKAVKVGCPDTCRLHFGYDLPIRYAASTLRDDVEFAHKVVAISGRSLKYFSRSVRNNRSVVLRAIESDPKAIKYTPLRHEKQVALIALLLCGDNLRYLPQFQDKPRYVELAISYRGELIRFASPRLKNDPFIATRAIIRSPFAICFVSPQLQYNREIAMLAVSKNGLVLEAIPRWAGNRDIVLAAVIQNPAAFKFASIELQNSIIFILQILSHDTGILQYLPRRLCNHPDIAYMAARTDFEKTVPFLDTWWTQCKELVMLGIRATPNAFHMACLDLTKDPEVRREYFKRYPPAKKIRL